MTSATGLAAHPPCPPQAGRAAAALAIALAGAFLLVGTATARPLRKGDGPSHAPSFARSCTIAAPETKPLFESKAEPASADDDDADADDNEDDKTAGVILPGSATCLSLSGTVSAGLQYDAYRVPQSGPAPPPNAFSFQTSGSLRIAASHDLASGLRIASAFEFTMRTPAEDGDTVSIDEATIQVGPWTFGLDSSRFNFWTGDEFIFSTRVPDRTVGVIALELPLTATWVATFAVEDPAVGSTTSLPSQAGRRVPDGVARLVYTSGSWALHGALALRDIPGPPIRLGRAGILGVTYEAEMLGRPGSITAQIAGAVDGAPYIGSQLDARVVRRVLLGTDPTRGFSGVVSMRREWTDQIATNLYLSRYHLAVPLAGQLKGKITIDRAAANLVWTPVKGLKAGLEASIAHARIALTGRPVPAGLAGRQISTQVFIERSF
ncbi:hypothetical protein [Bosea sp. (in: a-proteobacteria)]|uniref:hypothetical protein n=1 Tax=Bosea sp. (in: a-proteobacteria) TaxID=1871050 RepID=UPI003F714E7C